MLTGPDLGSAIEAARLKKGVTKKALAAHFGVAPPSIQDWVRRGTIDKAKLPGLWDYFSDVVGPAHWGLPSAQAPMSVAEQSPPRYAGPSLVEALPVVLARLRGLDDYSASKVLTAVQAAIKGGAPLDVIERDLVTLLSAPSPAKRTGTGG